MAKPTPKRRIIEAAGYGRRTRGGIMKAATLECGHLLNCNATDRRRGWMYCFDCYYGKPVSGLGQVIVEQYAEKQRRATQQD